MLLHGEQETVWGDSPVPIPPEARVTTTGRVAAVYDKGKGALVVLDNMSRDTDTGATYAANRMSVFIRGIGGFGGDRGERGAASPIPALLLSRPPDVEGSMKWDDNAALVYRLNGDTNPLHADPSMAAMGGFDKPILHGLATYGATGRVLLMSLANGDPKNFKSMKCRFTRHVFPGETVKIQAWVLRGGETAAPLPEGAVTSGDRVVFRVLVVERGLDEVLSNGEACIAGAGAVVAKGAHSKL
jgi:acyl dehydratase